MNSYNDIILSTGFIDPSKCARSFNFKSRLESLAMTLAVLDHLLKEYNTFTTLPDFINEVLHIFTTGQFPNR